MSEDPIARINGLISRCPFCGSTASFKYEKMNQVYHIECDARHSTCPVNARSHKCDGVVQAIELWNRRAPIDVLSDNIKFIEPSDRPITDKGEGQ